MAKKEPTVCMCGCKQLTRWGGRYLRGHNNKPSGTLGERFWAQVCKTETCWLWTGGTNEGYGVIYPGERHKRILAHRLSYEWHYGLIPAGLCVCHHCDTPLCVRPDHLFAGTRQDNNFDCYQKGRLVATPVMSDVEGLAFLRFAQTHAITTRELARMYGISVGSVIEILKRRGHWRFLQNI